MHSEGFRLFQQFWWLIFPLFSMVMGMFSLWLRHSRANRTIDILKNYAEQGKEPPPEVLAALRKPDFEKVKYGREGYWIPVFLFAALTAGFVMLGLTMSNDRQATMGLFFVAIIMGGLAMGFLVTALTMPRNKDQGPPP